MYISKQMFKQKCKGFNFAFKPIIYLIVKINNTYYLKNKEKENKQLLDSINKNKLDKNQRKIVLSEEDSTLVIAGAGSGKSLTILARILYLIKNDTNPKDILVISFTNEACNNLKEKLLKNNISTNVLTFHKLGRNILKNNGYSVNLVKENILEEIVSKVLKKTELTYCAKDKNLIKLLTTFINLFKGNGYAETKFNDFENQNKKEKGYLKDRNKELLFLAKQIFYEYQYYLEKNKNIDFHDMINKSIEIVQSKGIYSYKYIIVDEYQDTSLIKCKLLQTIKQKTKANLLAVGDDFQSIYQFTGSNLNVFIKFEKYFPNCKTFKLTTTYRNSRELLKITNNFILKNPKQIYKILTS
ncbi:MAG: ATP-dependent helicase, partial [Bacilli bacterium]|nr:ATP-dependent helicase [Bacilli bacterium]